MDWELTDEQQLIRVAVRELPTLNSLGPPDSALQPENRLLR
jgi:hypothetical protein